MLITFNYTYIIRYLIGISISTLHILNRKKISSLEDKYNLNEKSKAIKNKMHTKVFRSRSSRTKIIVFLKNLMFIYV